MNRIEKTKNHFEEEAKEFDQLILRLIPFYEEMVQALVRWNYYNYAVYGGYK